MSTTKRISHKGVREIVACAESQGWTHRFTGSGHLQLRSPGGAVVHTGQTPSDTRALRNFEARLARSGEYEKGRR